MYCNHCGSQNDSDSRFCIKCGNRLQESSGQSRTENVLFVPEKKSHTLRNIFLAVVVIGVLFFILILLAASESNTTTTTPIPTVSTTEGNSTNWEKFTSVEHNFIIDFPIYPTTERIPPETSNGFTYSGTQYFASTANDQDLFLAQGADYNISPEDFDNKTGLEGMLNALTTSEETTEGYKVTNSYFSVFKGFDALEFLGDFDNGTYSVKGIAFIRDDLSTIKSFLLMVASKDYFNLESLYNNFVSSFTLTN